MLTQNPYHPLAPPDDPTLFFGREDAVAFLRQHLVGAPNTQMLVLLGRQGIGKTSLLHQTNYVIDERYRTVYISLADAPASTPRAILQHMAHAILAGMERVGASTYRVTDEPGPEAGAAAYQTWFAEQLLDVAVTAIRRDRYLLLLLDDLHRLFQGIEAGQLPEDFMGYLGDLLTQHERLDILAGLDIRYESHTLGYPVCADMNFHWRLGPLDDEAAQRLLVEPVEQQYAYTDETRAAILALCGGYPFLIHSLCRLIYRFYEGSSRPAQIPPRAIEAVHTAALEETGEIIAPYWDDMTAHERAVLQLLLKLDAIQPATATDLDTLAQQVSRVQPHINQTKLNAVLRSLDYLHVITITAEGRYHFTTGLEAKWLAIQLAEQAQAAEGRRRAPNKTQLAGVVGVVLVLLIVGGFLLFGGLNESAPAADATPLPATSTLDVDIEATRRAE